MGRTAWHITDQDGVLRLSRRGAGAMDVAIETSLPNAGRRKVAQQMRQDLWRALQTVRGLSPVIEVARAGDMLRVRAGVHLACPAPQERIAQVIAQILNDPAHRQRWVNHARLRAQEAV